MAIDPSSADQAVGEAFKPSRQSSHNIPAALPHVTPLFTLHLVILWANHEGEFETLPYEWRRAIGLYTTVKAGRIFWLDISGSTPTADLANPQPPEIPRPALDDRTVANVDRYA